MTLFPSTRPRIAGVLLAAGLGRRFGGPKALADTGSGPWVLRALATLDALDPRLVVVGAAAGDVAALLPRGVVAVENPDFAGGMGSSLAAALRVLQGECGAGSAVDSTVDAAVIMLVDLPDVSQAVVNRVVRTVLDGARSAARNRIDGAASPATGRPDRSSAVSHTRPAGEAANSVIPDIRSALARATFSGRPGHPVLIGADHFAGVLAVSTGDHGARDYLATHPVLAVECGDLAGGADVDRKPE